MPDPINPNDPNPATTGTPTSTGTDPMSTGTQGMPATGTPPPTSTSTDPSFLSNIGGDISSFLSSPIGNLAEFGTLAAGGLAEASAQKTENQALAGTISNQGQPFTAAGAAELSQITGGPKMGGPMGASIDQQTAAASELGDVAKQYGTGNLTDAQNTQVKNFVAQQKAMAASELAAAGITDPNSQQFQTRMQQIDDNAAVLTQQLTQQNLSISEGALTAVQSTYTNLLNQSLSSAAFGLGAQESAVTLQIQQDTALAGQLQTLFAGIAQGYGNAMRPTSSGTPGRSVATPGAAPVAGQGAGGVATSAPGGGTSPATLRDTGGANSGIAAGGPPAADQAAFDQSMADQTVATDQTIASDTTAQQQIDQYAGSYTPPDITGGTDFVSSDIPSYTSDGSLIGDVTSDPFGGFGG